jgi:hypothetical protein
MDKSFSLVSQRITKPGAVIEAFKLTAICGSGRQEVIDAYDARGQLEISTNWKQVCRLNQLKTTLHDFLKAAHAVVKDASANNGVELDISQEIGELSQMLLAEFPLMKKPLAEFEAKSYLWHLRNH